MCTLGNSFLYPLKCHELMIRLTNGICMGEICTAQYEMTIHFSVQKEEKISEACQRSDEIWLIKRGYEIIALITLLGTVSPFPDVLWFDAEEERKYLHLNLKCSQLRSAPPPRNFDWITCAIPHEWVQCMFNSESVRAHLIKSDKWEGRKESRRRSTCTMTRLLSAPKCNWIGSFLSWLSCGS